MRSAAVLIAQRGLAATGMRDVADHAEAPRGSLHHYFPHGKDQLTDEALAAIGGAVRALLDDARTCPDSGGPAGTRVLDRFVGLWREGLRSTDMTLGCSVSAVVHDSVEPALLRRAAQVFDLWREPIAQELTATSVDPERAGALATTVVAALGIRANVQPGELARPRATRRDRRRPAHPADGGGGRGRLRRAAMITDVIRSWWHPPIRAGGRSQPAPPAVHVPCRQWRRAPPARLR